MKRLGKALIFCLLAAGCNLPQSSTPGVEPGPEVTLTSDLVVQTKPVSTVSSQGTFTSTVPLFIPTPDTLLPTPLSYDENSITGIWWGILTTLADGSQYQVRLSLAVSGTTVTGEWMSSDMFTNAVYQVSGTLAGNQFRFDEQGGNHFWGEFGGGTLNGKAALDCYDCTNWGEFTLGRGEPPSLGEVRFLDVQEGSTVSLTPGVFGPQVVTRVFASPLVQGSRIFLQADGLMMDMERSNKEGSFETALAWIPWHGDGNYVLQLTTWPYDLCCRQAIQTIIVNVSDFPADQPTLTQRFINRYRQNFGINITSPVIARYIQPFEDVVDKSRWVSAAYIGDELYEVEMQDNGTSDAWSRPIAHEQPQALTMCKPAGTYRMMFVFVDYGNTGITREQIMGSLASGIDKYNRLYLDQSRALGLTDPILQIHADGYYLSGPGKLGQVLTIAEIATRTGVDTSQYDLVTEIDLDANMSVAAHQTGLGFGGSGCNPGGSTTVDTYFVVPSEEYIDFVGTILDHELWHSMGWMHWWANGDGSVAVQGIADYKHNSVLPTRLFGWMDADGDGVIEILDSNPYGLTP